MVIQFTLQELMVFLLCAVGILAGGIALPILWNIKKVVGIFKPLVEINQDAIKKSIKSIPVIIGDMEQIGGNLKDTTNSLKSSLPSIIEEAGHVADTAKGSFAMVGAMMEKIGTNANEAVTKHEGDSTGYFHLFEEFMQLLYHTLFSEK